MNAPEETDHKLEDLIAAQDMRIARIRSAEAMSEPQAHQARCSVASGSAHDTERLDWADKNLCRVKTSESGLVKIEYVTDEIRYATSLGRTLREAIDSAMRATPLT